MSEKIGLPLPRTSLDLSLSPARAACVQFENQFITIIDTVELRHPYPERTIVRSIPMPVRRPHLKCLCFFPLLLLFLCGATLALAQSTDATISGVVVDPAGRVIPGAAIEIVNDATGAHYSSDTNGTGIYTVSILPPGQYRLQVSKVGFKTLIKPGIILNLQSAVALNFTLPLGAASESITVEAGTSEINTTDASVSTVIDRVFVENIPLNGRSFQDLLTLSPGVSQVANSYAPGYGAGYSGDIVVNGQRTEESQYTVDGVSANTGTMPGRFGDGAGVSGNVPALTALGTTQSLTSIDALQEFRSSTSTYSAEYGRSPGGQFSFRTRSGTNDLHGGVYDYLRNDTLDANNWFNDFYGYPKGKERQNDFGGTLGGPLILPVVYNGKDKTFFFVSYEGLRLDSPQAAIPVLVPDDTLRQQAPIAIQPLLNAFPVPDGGSDGLDDGFAYYIQSLSYPSNLNNTSIRVDHSIGGRLSIFGRYADSPSATTTYTASVQQLTKMTSQTATFGSTYSLGPHQSNEFRFNFTEPSGIALQASTNFGGATPLNLSTLPGLNNSPFPESGSSLNAVFTFASFTSIGLENLPSNQYQINATDTHTWLFGRHNVKAGVDWKRLATKLPAANPDEEVVFTSESQVRQNLPSLAQASAIVTNHAEPIYINFSSFLQDDWKLTSRLALSLGLRWDVNPAPTDAEGPTPYTVTQVTDLLTTQLAPRGTSLWRTDWAGFAPRFGLAYQLRPASRRNTVLRAGLGVFYDTGNAEGSLGYSGIGFTSSQQYSSASFPLTSEQLTVPAPSAATPYSTAVVGFDPNLRLPYSLEYSAALEQAFGTRDSFTMSYVGSGTRKLLTQFLTYPGALGNQAFAPSTVLQLTQGRASSSYNSLQAKFQRDLSRNLQVLVSYTWSHSIDNASNNFGIYYLLRASSDFDVRHSLQAAITYLPPRMRSSFPMTPLFDDWGFDFRLQARTAVPVDIIGNQEINLSTGQYLQYQPNLVAGQPLYLRGGGYPGGRIINYNAFAIAADGVQGNLPRNYARGFGELQLDTAIRRDIPIHDKFHLQFRAEAFNIFNHPMFGPVYNYLAYGPVLFGQAYNTLNSVGNLNSLYQSGGPRSLQVSLKAMF